MNPMKQSDEKEQSVELLQLPLFGGKDTPSDREAKSVFTFEELPESRTA
jgi:hypothetical protein